MIFVIFFLHSPSGTAFRNPSGTEILRVSPSQTLDHTQEAKPDGFALPSTSHRIFQMLRICIF